MDDEDKICSPDEDNNIKSIYSISNNRTFEFNTISSDFTNKKLPKECKKDFELNNIEVLNDVPAIAMDISDTYLLKNDSGWLSNKIDISKEDNFFDYEQIYFSKALRLLIF